MTDHFLERASVQGSNTEWLKTVLRSGTSKDKVSAMALLVNESPIHNLHSFAILVDNFISSNRRESMIVMGKMKILELGVLLVMVV